MYGEQEWHSSESTWLPPIWHGFESCIVHVNGLSLLLVLALLWGFFSRFSGFPPSTNTNTSKFQFALETMNKELLHGNHVPLQIPIYFIYLFIYNRHVQLLPALAPMPAPATRQPSISLCGSFLIISLSLQVPGSPSSAFTTRYLGL